MYDIVLRAVAQKHNLKNYGSSLKEWSDIYEHLNGERGYPLEFMSNEFDQEAIGVITVSAAEKIDFCFEDTSEDSGGFYAFFSLLLDHVRPEKGQNFVKTEFKNLSVLLLIPEDYYDRSEDVVDSEPSDGKTIYVYKEYNDAYAYGEELIKVFDSQADAEDFLVSRFCDQMGAESLEDYRDSDALEEDTVEEDYISIATGDGCMYWIIEAHRIIKEGEEV